MLVIIGTDHTGLELKKDIVAFLEAEGHGVKDMKVDGNAATDDYPDIAEITCREFKRGGYDFGILICGTGIGISISANKIDGIRCALLCDLFSARMAKEHNNANFIAFGGRMTYSVPVISMITEFMKAEFEGERHKRRVNKIRNLERKQD